MNTSQPAKGVAVFDLDGTLTRQDTFKIFLKRRMKSRPWRAITCAPLPIAYMMARKGLRDHVWLKQQTLMYVVGGSKREELAAFCADFAQQMLDEQITDCARAKLEEHKQRGDTVVLCSASFDFYVHAIGDALGFDHVICTKAAWKNDRLTGKIDGENCFADEKIRLLNLLLGEEGKGERAAYSDHHSDLPLLQWADRGVAVNPTKYMAEHAAEHNFEIVDWQCAA